MRCSLIIVWSMTLSCFERTITVRMLGLKFTGSALVAAALTTSGTALAQTAKSKPKTIPFLKTQVIPTNGTYIVLQDANVRVLPATKGRRIGRRARGDRVQVVGRAKGAWLAIRGGDGKDIGFIYRSTLMPIIDGALETTIEGRFSISASENCLYKLSFEGKTPAEGQPFEFADYDVKWNCDIAGQQVSFRTPMFLTEGPHRGKSKRDHQITIDIMDLADSPENVLSTHTLWHRDEGMVRFDTITVKQFARKPKVKELTAETLSEALQAAIRIAVSAWNKPLWAAIASR